MAYSNESNLVTTPVEIRAEEILNKRGAETSSVPFGGSTTGKSSVEIAQTSVSPSVKNSVELENVVAGTSPKNGATIQDLKVLGNMRSI